MAVVVELRAPGTLVVDLGGGVAPSGPVKVWDGTQWRVARQWNGVQWVTGVGGTVKQWNGTAWVAL